MDKNVNYLLGITNQLLDFQKMESGALQLSMKECSINALVSDIFNLFNGSVDLQGLTICLSLPPEEISVMIDSEKVSKILVNLVGNAIKYAKSQVEMRLILLGDRVNIIVSDDGTESLKVSKIRYFRLSINCRMIRWQRLQVQGLVWYLPNLWQKLIMELYH